MFQIRPRAPWGWRARCRECRVGEVANQWKACVVKWLVFDLGLGDVFSFSFR